MMRSDSWRIAKALSLSVSMILLPIRAHAICSPAAITKAEIDLAQREADLIVIGHFEQVRGTVELSDGTQRGAGSAKIVVDQTVSTKVGYRQEITFPYEYSFQDFCTVGYDPPFGVGRSIIYLKGAGESFKVILDLPLSEK